MNKKIFVAVLALLVLTCANAQKAAAQQSCPVSTLETYGVHAAQAVDKSLRSQIEITYFTTNDPNAFISERAGLKHSASYLNLSTSQFVARLESMEREGVASIRKQQAVTSYMGELAGLNLERDSASAEAHAANNRTSQQGSKGLHGSLYNLDRETTVGVYKGTGSESGYYHISLLSSFVNAESSQKVLDYDADVLLKPGETAIFKLTSDYELQRSGSVRTYMAVTMRGVANMSPASMAHARTRASR